jgi:hypothetical protein
MRTRRQGVQIGNWSQSEITRAQFPLVLSAPDGYDSIPWNPLTWERLTLGNLATYEQAYVKSIPAGRISLRAEPPTSSMHVTPSAYELIE